MRRRELIGERFDRLTVLSDACSRLDGRGHPRRYVNVSCDCGGTKVVRSAHLLNGRTRSCGCLQQESRKTCNVTHGATAGRRKNPQREYKILRGIIGRCDNPSANGYKNYGGRGITVCDRWRFGEHGWTGFECFLADMGLRPSPRHSIDRFPDNDGNYEPGNCRWATPKEQAWTKLDKSRQRRERAAAKVTDKIEAVLTEAPADRRAIIIKLIADAINTAKEVVR